MSIGLDGRRNFKGELVGVDGVDGIVVEVDGTKYELPFADITKANLVAEL